MKISGFNILKFQIIVFFIFSNLVMNHFICRMDISQSERLTLSESAQNRIKKIKEPLLIEAYYSSDLPIEYNIRLELIREFLFEVQKQNSYYIKIKFLDPSSSIEIRKKAIDAGLTPNEIHEASETSKSYQEAFMGIVIKYESSQEVISDYFFVEEAETKLLRALRRIDQKKKTQRVGIVSDPGTFAVPIPGEGSGISTWGVFYHQAFVEEYGKPYIVSLNESSIPDVVQVLLIVGSPEWNETAKSKLDAFIFRGGNVIFLLSSMQLNLSPVRDKDGLSFVGQNLAYPNAGYQSWSEILKNYGFDFATNLLFDFEHPVSLSKVSNLQKQYYPLWQYFYKSEGNLHENHFLTENTELLILPWVSSVNIDHSKQKNFKYEIILSTDVQNWKKNNVFSLDVNQKFKEDEVNRNRASVGILASGKIYSYLSDITSKFDSKIFVLSSAHFMSDILSLPEFRNVYKNSNVSFLLNLIDYMLDDKEFMNSRTKKSAVFPLKSFSNRERNFYSFFNTLVIPFFLIVFAMRRIYFRYSRVN
ncbi:MAG: GldG family protein [Leptospira sp.]|nr:GldG family protein [Leptospira sp.]